MCVNQLVPIFLYIIYLSVRDSIKSNQKTKHYLLALAKTMPSAMSNLKKDKVPYPA